LFADVELAGRAEATTLEAMGLGIDEDDVDGPVLSQPCRALRGTRCGIYAHRPEGCRTFECRLLRGVRDGTLGVERAGARIAEARERIRRLRRRTARRGRRSGCLPLQESCAETLGRDAQVTPEAIRRRTELEAVMAAVQELLRRNFLDGGERS